MFQSNFYNLEFYLKSNIALNFQKIICRIWANQEKDKRILFLRGSGRSHGSLEIYKSIYKVYTSTSLQGLQGLQVYKVYKSTSLQIQILLQSFLKCYGFLSKLKHVIHIVKVILRHIENLNVINIVKVTSDIDIYCYIYMIYLIYHIYDDCDWQRVSYVWKFSRLILIKFFSFQRIFITPRPGLKHVWNLTNNLLRHYLR